MDNELIFLPVLYLDTLKVSDINQSSEKTSQRGGYGNQQLLHWQHSKKFNLKIEDALFSPISMNMTMGWVKNIGSKYITLIKKLNIVNKYFKNNYSIYAYKSPQLTEEEKMLLFKLIEELYPDIKLIEQDKFIEYAAQNRYKVLHLYNKRDKQFDIFGENNEELFPTNIINKIFQQINEVKDFNQIKTNHYNIQVLDRMEKCYVSNDEGLNIDINEQIQSLYKYYNDDKSCNYFIYYDEKTMQPLALFNKKWFNRINENNQIEWTPGFEIHDEYGRPIEDKFTLKKGTIYYKWSRTIQPVLSDNGFIGQSLIIDGDSFPGKYKIVGETYIREQNGVKDQRYQFVIPYATVPSDQKIELKADGGPSVFNMEVEVLTKDGKPPIELRQFDVDKDIVNGGTRVVPESTQYTYTPIIVKNDVNEVINNEEIYF